MVDIDFIGQEKLDKELDEVASKIINLLDDFNVAEKYKVIKSLYDSLVETITKDMGGVIKEREEEGFSL